MHKILRIQTPANLYEEYQAHCPASNTHYSEHGNYIIPIQQHTMKEAASTEA